MKYIYLDWNVYKYLNTPRQVERDQTGHDTDLQMKTLVSKLSSKYVFPYSEGHIRDIANKYIPENRSLIERDLRFAETINHQICVAYGYQESQLLITTLKKPMIEFFDEYVSDNNKIVPSADSMNDANYITPFPVDMNKIQTDHPLYDYLESNNGVMDLKKLNEYLVTMFDEIFTKTEKYKNLRKYVGKLDEDEVLNQKMNLDSRLLLDRYLYYMFPFIDSFDDTEESLSMKWPGIVSRYLEMHYKNPAYDMKLIHGYALLDMHPLFKEKLKNNKNTLDNIVRDGSHCFYASNAECFVSEDATTRRKIKFIYKAYGIKTKVVSEEEFINSFDIITP